MVASKKICPRSFTWNLELSWGEGSLRVSTRDLERSSSWLNWVGTMSHLGRDTCPCKNQKGTSHREKATQR